MKEPPRSNVSEPHLELAKKSTLPASTNDVVELANVAATRGFDLSLKTPPSERDLAEARLKGRVFLGLAVVLVLVGIVTCLATLFWVDGTSADDKKWAQSLLFFLVGSALGFLGGPKASSS